jgi:hypothetical protein
MVCNGRPGANVPCQNRIMAAVIWRSLHRCCCPDEAPSGNSRRHQLVQPLVPPKSEDAARSAAAHTPILPPQSAGCLTMHYERHPATGHARLRISVVRDLVTDDAIELLLSYSLRAVDLGEPFLVLWDLRQCALPKTSQVGFERLCGGRTGATSVREAGRALHTPPDPSGTSRCPARASPERGLHAGAFRSRPLPRRYGGASSGGSGIKRSLMRGWCRWLF